MCVLLINKEVRCTQFKTHKGWTRLSLRSLKDPKLCESEGNILTLSVTRF